MKRGSQIQTVSTNTKNLNLSQTVLKSVSVQLKDKQYVRINSICSNSKCNGLRITKTKHFHLPKTQTVKTIPKMSFCRKQWCLWNQGFRSQTVSMNTKSDGIFQTDVLIKEIYFITTCTIEKQAKHNN